MWFNLDGVTQSLSVSANSRSSLSAEDVEKHNRRIKKEKEINELGIAICFHCDEEIYQNKDMKAAGWSWESADMLGWCEKNPNHVHYPKIEVD